MLPIQGDGTVFAVAGNKPDRLGMITMGQWNTAVGGTAAGGGDTRDHLKIDALLDNQIDFFPATAKDKRVTTLETTDLLALFGVVHQQLVDVVLRQGVFVAGLTHIDHFRIPAGKVHNTLAYQAVV